MVQAHVLLKRWVKDEEGQTAKLLATPTGAQLSLSPEEYMQVREHVCPELGRFFLSTPH